MAKKKILLVNDLTKGGGVEKLMYDLAWAWHDKYDCTVMSFDVDNEFYDRYPANVGYITMQVPNQYKQNLVVHAISSINRRIYEGTLQSRVEKMGFDIMLCMKEGTTMRDMAKYNIPLKFAWNHTDYNSSYYTKNIFGSSEEEIKCMQQFKKIVCVSKNIEEGIKDVIGDPGNLIVKYNPINAENILEMANEKVVDVESIDLPKQKVRFVTVGRINYQKGFLNLIEACHFLEMEGYDYEVIVVGGKEPWGEESGRIDDSLKRLQIKNVKFIGPRQNAYKYMAIADWFISSSLYEGYSLVSQEAAILDIPLMLTNCSGVDELLGNNEYGIVMDNSVAGIYKSMKRVLDEPTLHEYYKSKIIERKKIITYQERIDEIEKLFG